MKSNITYGGDERKSSSFGTLSFVDAVAVRALVVWWGILLLLFRQIIYYQLMMVAGCKPGLGSGLGLG